MWEKRKPFHFIVNKEDHSPGPNEDKRMCDLAEIQSRSGSYFVVQRKGPDSEDFTERMNNMKAMKIKRSPNEIWTNSEVMYAELKTRIEDGGYNEDTVRAMRRGVLKQIEKREWQEDDNSWIAYLDNDGIYRDEVTGEVLNEDGVKRARMEEIGELEKREVYVKVPIEECYENTKANPIKVKWVDVN